MYDVMVQIGKDDWYNMVTFGTVSRCVSWMLMYDPDGTVPMQIIDRDTNAVLTFAEIVQRMRTKPETPEPTSWQNDGF